MIKARVRQGFFIIAMRLVGPRRCGRIAGCRAFQPTPGLAYPAVRPAGAGYSVFERSGYRFAL